MNLVEVIYWLPAVGLSICCFSYIMSWINKSLFRGIDEETLNILRVFEGVILVLGAFLDFLGVLLWAVMSFTSGDIKKAVLFVTLSLVLVYLLVLSVYSLNLSWSIYKNRKKGGN